MAVNKAKAYPAFWIPIPTHNPSSIYKIPEPSIKYGVILIKLFGFLFIFLLILKFLFNLKLIQGDLKQTYDIVGI